MKAAFHGKPAKWKDLVVWVLILLQSTSGTSAGEMYVAVPHWARSSQAGPAEKTRINYTEGEREKEGLLTNILCFLSSEGQQKHRNLHSLEQQRSVTTSTKEGHTLPQRPEVSCRA